MVGILLTGHGKFASALKTSIDIIAGEFSNFEIVDFQTNMDDLDQDLLDALNALKDCDGILIFTDLLGGIPFQRAVLLTREMKNIEIMSGVNVPMLAEILCARKKDMDLETLKNMALIIGKDKIMCFSHILENQKPNEDVEDGI